MTQHPTLEPRMWQLYRHELMPVAELAHEMSTAGWPIDGRRVEKIRLDLQEQIAELESQLPEALAPRREQVWRQRPAPAGTYRPKTLSCKGAVKDGTRHAKAPITFTAPGDKPCPVCGTPKSSGKMEPAKIVKVQDYEMVRPWRSPAVLLEYAAAKKLPLRLHKKTKQPTADKQARQIWAQRAPEMVTVSRLYGAQKLITSYAKPEWRHEPRLYFRFNPIGTAETRWSCSGQRRGIDCQVQNVPKIGRKVFLPAEPGFAMLQLDWQSGENNLTALLAGDMQRLERLRTPGYSEHADTASKIFETEVSKGDPVTYDLYQIGKKVNHGVNYGMGPKLLLGELTHALNEIGSTLSLTQADCKRFLDIWREMNPQTARWQELVVAEAYQNGGALTNVFGRTRWFPADKFKTAALAFLPASTLAGMMNRCLLALHQQRYAEHLDVLRVQVRRNLPERWRLMAQIHDSIIASGPPESLREAATAIRDVMTQPWPELNGFALQVDVEYSMDSWGAMQELEL